MNAETEYERLCELLPFYVNGTLDEASRRQVEVALAFSPELRDRLDEERALAGAIEADTRARLGEAAPESETAIGQAIAGLPREGISQARGNAAGGGAGQGGLAGALAFLNPMRWNPSVVLGAGIIGLGGLSGYQAMMIEKLESDYALLAGQCEQSQAGTVLVEFASDASWSDIAALLDTEGLHIVGTGSFGTATLHADGADAELDAVIGRLRASPLVATADKAA